VMGCWLFTPMRWNGVHFFHSVEILFVVKFRIVVDKDARIPRSLKGARTTVKALRGFIQQNITTRQNDLMCVWNIGLAKLQFFQELRRAKNENYLLPL
jgi:hypothetical protein